MSVKWADGVNPGEFPFWLSFYSRKEVYSLWVWRGWWWRVRLEAKGATMSGEAKSTFKLFSSPGGGGGGGGGGGLGFLDSLSSDPPLPPPPPPIEVLPSQVSTAVKCSLEPVNLVGLTLLKGRVSTRDVFGLPNSDLVPGVYEGGLKLWEGSLDLVKALGSEVHNGRLSFTGKQVLELGCGHGLPGIFACLEGAAAVHFQDFNAEVLRCLTIPNANANLSKKFDSTRSNETHSRTSTELRFFAGDWSQIHQCLPHVHNNEKDLDSPGQNSISGYDIILMAETIYSISAQHSLYGLIKKSISSPCGVVYMAAKKHYFGVGGGTHQFLSMVEKDGIMAASLIAEVADGSSNVREVWKFSIK